jgi:hypothetical protein
MIFTRQRKIDDGRASGGHDPGIEGISSRGLEKRKREDQANRRHRPSCFQQPVQAVLNKQAHPQKMENVTRKE